MKRLTGETPLPTNIEFGGEMTDSCYTVEFSQQLLDFSFLDPRFRQIVDRLEQESISSALPFREMAAFVFIYKDGDIEEKIFTSNAPTAVDAEPHFKAIEEAGILDELDEGRIPQRIVHMHTHPGMEYKPEGQHNLTLMINPTDYTWYQNLSTFFSVYAGDDIPVTGIVRPVGKNCENAFFETTVEPDANRTMVRRALAAKKSRLSP